MKTIILHFVSVVCFSLLQWQVTDAQEQLPTLKVIEVRQIDRVTHVSGYKNKAVVLMLSNITTNNIIVYGQTFEGDFVPTASKLSVIDASRQLRYFDGDSPVILKKGDLTFTAKRILRPGEFLMFTRHIYSSNSCDSQIGGVVWVRIGKSKELIEIDTDLDPVCQTKLEAESTGKNLKP